MKKYIPILVVIVLVLSIVGIAKVGPVWASPKLTSRANSPLLTLITVTSNGNYNIGGVCDITVDFKTTGNQVKADSEVPIEQSKLVPFYGDAHLLFPGCHFVFYKNDKIVSPVNTNDVTLKVCFGASPELTMEIYYYLDNPGSAGRVWMPLPTTMEDEGRLVCAPAIYTGVYMPTGKVVPPSNAAQPGANPFFPGGTVGSVQTPPSEITITSSGSYAVGGICLLKAKYYVTQLSDTIQVEYPKKHYTEETKTVPFDAYYVNGDLFYFPGCHVIHYRDQVVQVQMNKTIPLDGDWQICFAAIPGKTMTIYFYPDDIVSPIVPPDPWRPLVTITQNGMACADLVDFSAVYTPAGK